MRSTGIVLGKFAQVRQRRQDDQVDTGRDGTRGDLVQQGMREGAIAMEFPVTRHDPTTHIGIPVLKPTSQRRAV